jgi:hypothetical protein
MVGHDEKERKTVWAPQTEHKFVGEDELTLLEGSTGEVAELLNEKLAPNEFYQKGFKANKGTKPMDFYIRELQKEGLDICKGECTFGYKMPLPEKGSDSRYLIIFRRKE